MPELVLHDRPIVTVFDLLGRDENDMTASLGWGLAHSSALLGRFVERVAPGVVLSEPPAIELQKHDRADGGFTDIELLAPELHVIVEAKIGWNPPSEAQLHRYEDRFAKTAAPAKRVVVLTQNGAERVVRHRLGAWAPGPSITLAVVGWSDLVSMAPKVRSSSLLGHPTIHARMRDYATIWREIAMSRAMSMAVRSGRITLVDHPSMGQDQESPSHHRPTHEGPRDHPDDPDESERICLPHSLPHRSSRYRKPGLTAM